jgi:hypothetical protein
LSETRIVSENGGIALHKNKIAERYEWNSDANLIYSDLRLVENGLPCVHTESIQKYLGITNSETFFRYMSWMNKMADTHTWKVMGKFDHELRQRMSRLGEGSFDPCHLIHQFLTNQATSSDMYGKDTTKRLKNNNKNYCNKYNAGDECDKTTCKFTHQCSNCGGKRHTAKECKKK